MGLDELIRFCTHPWWVFWRENCHCGIRHLWGDKFGADVPSFRYTAVLL